MDPLFECYGGDRLACNTSRIIIYRLAETRRLTEHRTMHDCDASVDLIRKQLKPEGSRQRTLRHASGRPPLATAVVSELLSSILGDNDPRLVGLGPGCPGSHGIGTP